MFELGKYLAALAFPPGIILVLLLLSLLLAARGKRKPAIITGSIAAALLYLLSISPIADLLIAPLEDRYASLTGSPKAGTIVVLGGGSVLHSPEYSGHAALIESGATRAAYGARLSRELTLPIVYSGGAPLRDSGTETEAEAAKRFLTGIGIAPDMILIENKSNDTRENAAFIAGMGLPRPVILVTSAFHMPRSVLAFKKAGMEVIPAPTDFRRNREAYRLIDFMPSAIWLEQSALALHEYIGLVYYMLT
jgi:uncharacterized SAM-binding protein YcdF (DUF218 family)